MGTSADVKITDQCIATLDDFNEGTVIVKESLVAEYLASHGGSSKESAAKGVAALLGLLAVRGEVDLLQAPLISAQMVQFEHNTVQRLNSADEAGLVRGLPKHWRVPVYVVTFARRPGTEALGGATASPPSGDSRQGAIVCLCRKCGMRYVLGVNSVVTTMGDLFRDMAARGRPDFASLPAARVPDGIQLIPGHESWPESAEAPSPSYPSSAVSREVVDAWDRGESRRWTCGACQTEQEYQWPAVSSRAERATAQRDRLDKLLFEACAFPGDALDKSRLLIKRHTSFFRVATEYEICDPDTGKVILECQEEGPGLHIKFLRFVGYRRMSPFDFRIRTIDGRPVLRVTRRFGFFLSQVMAYGPNGELIGGFRQKFWSLKGKFEVLDFFERPVGSLAGKWTSRGFAFVHDGTEFARVTKKWGGLGDNYTLSISSEVPVHSAVRGLILAAVICIDMSRKK